jgi:hypothetical protein
MPVNPENPYNAWGAGSFNYYKPGAMYGQTQYPTPNSWGQTPIGDNYLERERDATFTRWSGQHGVRDNDPFGDYVRSQQSKVFGGYKAALGTNQNLKFQDFLNDDLMNQFRNDFSRLTQGQRGESTGQFAQRARQQRW